MLDCLMRLRMSPKAGLLDKHLHFLNRFILIAFITLDQIALRGTTSRKEIRGEDPVNYFGIAHSILFDHDFNLSNEYERMPPDGRFWTANQPGTGLPGSPWGLGYSFLEVPLLALGTGVDAVVAGNPADGYSHWAVFFYCIGSPLLVGCGMAALFLLLRSVGEYWGILPEDHQSAYALFVTLAIFLRYQCRLLCVFGDVSFVDLFVRESLSDNLVEGAGLGFAGVAGCCWA